MRERAERRSDEEWRSLLTPEQFAITRRKGTEPAYSGRYVDFNGSGVYRCVCCGSALFSSLAKFEARSPWPAFWDPAAKENIRTEKEVLHFIVRIEVLCAQCDAHLGYVFEDVRSPSGVRYFINALALAFVVRGGRRSSSGAWTARRTNDWAALPEGGALF